MFTNGQCTVATSRDLRNSFFTIFCDHAFILCYYCYMLSGIFPETACPETLHRSGCFDSHMYIIYLVGCVVFASLHGTPIRSYFVEAMTALQSHSFTKWLRRLRSDTLRGRCFITCFYKTSAIKTYSHTVMSFRFLCQL